MCRQERSSTRSITEDPNPFQQVTVVVIYEDILLFLVQEVISTENILDVVQNGELFNSPRVTHRPEVLYLNSNQQDFNHRGFESCLSLLEHNTTTGTQEIE